MADENEELTLLIFTVYEDFFSLVHIILFSFRGSSAGGCSSVKWLISGKEVAAKTLKGVEVFVDIVILNGVGVEVETKTLKVLRGGEII